MLTVRGVFELLTEHDVNEAIDIASSEGREEEAAMIARVAAAVAKKERRHRCGVDAS